MTTTRTISLDRLDDRTRAAWNGLVRRGAFNPSLTPGWIEVAADALIGARREIDVFLRSGDDGELDGVVPFFRRERRVFGVPVRTLHLATNAVSYHAEVAATRDVPGLVAAMLAAAGDWDVLHAGNLPVDGPTVAALRELAARTGGELMLETGQVSPYMALSGTFDETVAAKDRKFRYKVRKRAELIAGPAALTWYVGEQGADELLGHILEVERRSWKRAEGTDIPSRPEEVEYHARLLPYLAREGALRAAVVSIAGRPIAYILCAEFDGWVGVLKTSFDQEFADLSPGALVVDVALRAAFERGAREFDFLGDPAPYKAAWTAEVRRHTDVYLYRRALKPTAIARLKQWRSRRAAAAGGAAATAQLSANGDFPATEKQVDSRTSALFPASGAHPFLRYSAQELFIPRGAPR